MKAVPGTFNQYPLLVGELPRLVRRQRRLERQIASIGDAIAVEKQTRQQIDELLVGVGLKKGEHVTCLGFDVTHNERDGRDSINEERLLALLEAAGLDAEYAADLVKAATDDGKDAKFATVRPSKGAAVRADRAVAA